VDFAGATRHTAERRWVDARLQESDDVNTAAQGAYGEGIARHLHLENAPVVVTSTRRHATLGITRLRCERPEPALSTSIPREDAFLVTTQLRHVSRIEVFLGMRSVHTGAYVAGRTNILHLESDPTAYLCTPYDGVQFYVPREALNEIADEQGAPHVDELQCPDAAELEDPVVPHLAACAMPALENPDQVSPLFIQHIALALGVHLMQRYGGVRVRESVNGTLAPWQLRRATELLRAHLDGDIPLTKLAAECNLSRSHFTRAFKRSTGMPPHRWLLARRVDKAKDLMRTTAQPLSEIALACGFSEQAHLTRVFSRFVGMTPSAWRRAQWRDAEPAHGRSRAQKGPPARGTE
jgi:AraC-like DNA-binding protein